MQAGRQARRQAGRKAFCIGSNRNLTRQEKGIVNGTTTYLPIHLQDLGAHFPDFVNTVAYASLTIQPH